MNGETITKSPRGVFQSHFAKQLPVWHQRRFRIILAETTHVGDFKWVKYGKQKDILDITRLLNPSSQPWISFRKVIKVQLEALLGFFFKSPREPNFTFKVFLVKDRTQKLEIKKNCSEMPRRDGNFEWFLDAVSQSWGN